MPGALTRWDPFAELADLRTRFDHMLSEIAGSGEHAWTPAIDVERDNGDLVLRADLPGIKPEEVKIEVKDDMLRIFGAHEEVKEEKGKDYVRRERRHGSFFRSVALPPGVDPHSIEAKTHDGVLEVKVPLPQESEQAVQITATAA